MFNKPTFKEHFHVEIIEPDTVYLLTESTHFALSGRLHCQLAPLLNGHYTTDEIVNKLKGQFSTATIYCALMLLQEGGYITEADHTLTPEVAAFWHSLNIDSSVATTRLHETRVSVTSFGGIPIEPFVAALQSLNISINNKADLAVVLTDDYLQVGLSAFNREALSKQQPWMLIKPVGNILWIGPIFRPGKTGCWECLAERLGSNREVEAFVQKKKGISAPFPTSLSILPSTLHTGLNLAATEIAKWIICGENENLDGQVVTFDMASLNLQHHTLVRRPQCPCCGDPEYFRRQELKPLILNSCKKQFTTDGGHRSVSPEQTLKKYEYHISPITGIVNQLARTSEDGDSLVHVYFAAHFFNEPANNLQQLRRVLCNKSGGKGKTDLQSKVSGLCEALERYSGLYTGNERRVTATYAQMGDKAIHPYSCIHFSAAQYEKRHEWNQQNSDLIEVPEPFDEKREIEWTPVWSLTHQTFKYLPLAYSYYGSELPKGHRFCHTDSNGCASGNNIEEAILQGFLELVERDSIALWWYNRIKRTSVDLASFDEPYLLALQAYYQNQQRDLWVLDITSDMNIPVFAAISRRNDQAEEEIMLGYGAHFDPKIAVLRAVTEMNQMTPLKNILYDVIDSGKGKNDRHLLDLERWFKTATCENQPYLAPDPNIAPKVYGDYPRLWSDDLKQDVLKCVEIAAEHGLETLILDQTRPEVGLRVVKVIVPGLRHHWPRFGPGRLYDVPVQLGWLPASLTEEQLNPIPILS
ncbi:TOMM precursor leader peptide-binding protein [Cylindrospermum sp. FACHB-282]|uniref:TOMM precursor leader peptide-binding protein n=1 Tax=Cylindrospermum sp. FACHB-282 TaxID=2692794 RepID=UPI001682D567|nr:TOMM precursor leader peptide-binding protein [Cylindrospermum sp. FACHB-282]MBD2385860.1 TOMM precursor leader peptide-binding protein [Cylindrospermum sp. FACHB-282]